MNACDVLLRGMHAYAYTVSMLDAPDRTLLAAAAMWWPRSYQLKKLSSANDERKR
jgi:hypothetical protein